jgi:hypothetical protein
MIEIKPYVPILRWRPAELTAVEKLFPDDRNKITPLIEFIMPPPKLDKHDYKKVLEDSRSIFLSKLHLVPQLINKAWGNQPVFVDVHLLDGDIRASSLKAILATSDELDLFSIPVTYILPVIGTDADIETRKVAIEFSKIKNRGLCIRLDISHFKDEGLAGHVSDFLLVNELKASETDILIDLGIIDGKILVDDLKETLERVPFLEEWRSFIIAGGAFPKDLSDFPKHGHYQVQRLDFKLWDEYTRHSGLKRPVSFSDYTIQHPIFYGHTPGVNPSASIRYTNDFQWEIMRGEGLRNKDGAGHKQYPAHAKLLIEQSFFKGASYSTGDTYIAERGREDNTLSGNPTTWLTAGINHHLTLVARQISNFVE